MPRRSPIEAFINQTSDRSARYEMRKRSAGFVKCCVWVPASRDDELKAIARQWCADLEAEKSGSGPP